MDKKKRKEIVKPLMQDAIVKEISQMPISKKDLRDLFDWLDRDGALGCNHTLRQTNEFLQKRGLNSEAIVPWLNNYGGYCDCEVLANVESEWQDKT